MVNSQAITITTVLVACLVSIVVFLNSGSDGSDGAGIPAQSRWTVSQDGFTQYWYLDIDAGAMRVETGFETGLMEVNEFSEAGTSSFQMLDLNGWSATELCNSVNYDGDCAAAAASLKADLDAIAEEGKTDCSVAGSSETFAVSQDGNTLTVGPFTVKLGADGMPASIEGEGWSATVDSIEETDVTLTGCDERRHTAENKANMDYFEVMGAARRNMGEVSAEVQAFRDAFDPIVAGFHAKSEEQAAEHGRKLNPLTQLTAWATGTNWCGPGNSQQGAPTPGDGVNVGRSSGGNSNEWGCFRHDHGACVKEGSIPTLGCQTDKNILDYMRSAGQEPWWIEFFYGEWGLGGGMGCVNAGVAGGDWHWQSPYACGWRGCNGGWWYWHTHPAPAYEVFYGPRRYNRGLTNYGYRLVKITNNDGDNYCFPGGRSEHPGGDTGCTGVTIPSDLTWHNPMTSTATCPGLTTVVRDIENQDYKTCVVP